MALSDEDKIEQVSMDGETVKQFKPSELRKASTNSKLEGMECDKSNTHNAFKSIFGVGSRSIFFKSARKAQ